MKKNLKIFAPLALVLMLGVLTIAFAQTEKAGKFPGEGHHGRPAGGLPIGGGLHPGMLAELNLTDQQQEQIKTIHEKARTDSEAYFEKMKSFQERLKAATENGGFNEEQVRQILTEKAEVMTEIEVIRLRADSAIFSLLTTEQKAKLEQLKQRAPEFGHGRGGDFRPPMPPPQN